MRRFIVLLALVLSACATPSRPPVVNPPPPPVKPTGYLAVWVSDPAGKPVVGAEVHADGVALPDHANGDGWSGVAAPFGSYTVRIAADFFKPVERSVTVDGHTDLRITLERTVIPATPVRVDGRYLVNEQGTFRALFQSGLTLLVRTPEERDAFLDQTVAMGLNGVRVFAGYLEWAGQTPDTARANLNGLIDAAAARGLYVYVCAITGGHDTPYDVPGHLRAVVDIVRSHPNALLEVANEIGHPTLTDLAKDPATLRGWAVPIVNGKGVTWTLGAAADEPEPDGSFAGAGGDFNEAHLDRGRDLYNQVRRVREMEGISSSTKKPQMSGEPMGIAEVPMPGKQRFWNKTSPEQPQSGGFDDAALRFSYTYGVLCRGFEISCVFHSEDGLWARALGPQTQLSAKEFVAGFNSIPTTERLTFMNAGWAGSPVSSANFDGGLTRAYSFITGSRGWTVLVGVTGDPRVVWGGGWRAVGVVASRPGTQVIEITK